MTTALQKEIDRLGITCAEVGRVMKYKGKNKSHNVGLFARGERRPNYETAQRLQTALQKLGGQITIDQLCGG